MPVVLQKVLVFHSCFFQKWPRINHWEHWKSIYSLGILSGWNATCDEEEGKQCKSAWGQGAFIIIDFTLSMPTIFRRTSSKGWPQPEDTRPNCWVEEQISLHQRFVISFFSVLINVASFLFSCVPLNVNCNCLFSSNLLHYQRTILRGNVRTRISWVIVVTEFWQRWRSHPWDYHFSTALQVRPPHPAPLSRYDILMKSSCFPR